MRVFALLLTTMMAAAAVPANYEQAIKAEREQRTKALLGPRSWFSLVALRELTPGDVSVGSAAGNTVRLEHGAPHAFTLHVEGNQVTLASVDGAVRVGGNEAKSGETVAVSDSPQASLTWDGLWANVIKRTGNQILLRVGDPHSPNIQHFHGLNFYPVNPEFRITAKWVPYIPPHEVRMGTVLGTTLIEPSPGYAEFTVGGQTVRLDATDGDRALVFSFRDGTFRTTTYGAGRELVAEPPPEGVNKPGTVVLDFNKAINWPCAYTEFGTCPLPPPQNRFTAEILAGEKRYHE